MSYTGIYGNIKIKKTYCKRCETTCFVIDGIKQCCDRPLNEKLTQVKKLEVAPIKKRFIPKKKERDYILFSQNEKCLYCDKPFGTLYERNDKVRKTKLNWDHFVPYSFSFDNRKINFVASCNICNGIKSNKMFDTLEEAKVYVEYRRKKKGYKYYEDR